MVEGVAGIMCVLTDGTEKDLPGQLTKLCDNSISVVWRSSLGHVYKRSTPFLIENELYFYEKLYSFGIVPFAQRYDKYTLEIQDLGMSEPVTDSQTFRENCMGVLAALELAGVRHGDLTEYAIIVRDNKPYLIDFAESRMRDDPRPDKRVGGDELWMNKAIENILKK